MISKYVAFDLEIAQELPDGCNDITPYRPLGITCAAAAVHTNGKEEVYSFYPDIGDDGAYEPRMSVEKCRDMFDMLGLWQGGGYDIVTWNGLGFDFDVLAEEVQCRAYADESLCDVVKDRMFAEAVAKMAMNSVDPAFVMLCAKGYMIGLNTAAKGLGVEGKTEGMHGDLAPIMWKQGREEQEKTIAYVMQDAVATSNVYRAMVELGGVRWISRSGRLNKWYHSSRDYSVGIGLKIPEPDTSWMSEPRTRKSVYDWTQKYLSKGDL